MSNDLKVLALCADDDHRSTTLSRNGCGVFGGRVNEEGQC